MSASALITFKKTLRCRIAVKTFSGRLMVPRQHFAQISRRFFSFISLFLSLPLSFGVKEGGAVAFPRRSNTLPTHENIRMAGGGGSLEEKGNNLSRSKRCNRIQKAAIIAS